MRLVVDANILVSELVRGRGRALIADPHQQNVIAAFAWDEATYEFRRVNHV